MGREHTPSMKNDNRVQLYGKDAGKIKRSSATRIFLRNFAQKVRDSRDLAGFDLIPEGTPASLFVYAQLTTQDGDNVYTTVQEALQRAIIVDDAQVKAGRFIVNQARHKELEYVLAFVWALPVAAFHDKNVAEDAHIEFYQTVFRPNSLAQIIALYTGASRPCQQPSKLTSSPGPSLS